jgi:hypothetical protein
MSNGDSISAVLGVNAGLVPAAAIKRTAQIVNTIVPAGQTLPIYQAGEAFYIIFANGVVQIRPTDGTFNGYTTGTGVRADPQNNFPMLEVRNENAFAVVLSLWVGFGDYIDNRINLTSSPVVPVTVPGYDFKIGPASNNVVIPDLSATPYTDFAGNNWLLVSRASLLVSNADNSVIFALHRRGVAIQENAAFLLAFPTMSINVDVQEDIGVNEWGGASNLVGTIAELYNAIPA